MTDRERDAASLPPEFYRILVEQIDDGVIVSDEHGVLRIFNPAAERQHGAPRQEIAAPQWGDTYGLYARSGEKLPLHETPLFKAVRGEKVLNATWIVRLPDGTERILSGTATPLKHEDGSSAGAVLITRDETERVAAEAQRATLLEREQAARAEAERERRAAEALSTEVIAQMRAVEQALRDARAREEALVRRIEEATKALAPTA